RSGVALTDARHASGSIRVCSNRGAQVAQRLSYCKRESGHESLHLLEVRGDHVEEHVWEAQRAGPCPREEARRRFDGEGCRWVLEAVVERFGLSCYGPCR